MVSLVSQYGSRIRIRPTRSLRSSDDPVGIVGRKKYPSLRLSRGQGSLAGIVSIVLLVSPWY